MLCFLVQATPQSTQKKIAQLEMSFSCCEIAPSAFEETGARRNSATMNIFKAGLNNKVQRCAWETFCDVYLGRNIT